MTRLLIIIISALVGIVSAAAQQQATIVSHIMADSMVTISQPAGLDERLRPTPPPPAAIKQADELEAATEPEPTATPSGRMAGYRVQVFSDNNSRTAKNEARAKAHTVGEQFPQYRTYVSYTSPYWRLKVGDFRTRHEAETVAEEMRRAFPAFGKEIRVVRDRITIQD